MKSVIQHTLHLRNINDRFEGEVSTTEHNFQEASTSKTVSNRDFGNSIKQIKKEGGDGG